MAAGETRPPLDRSAVVRMADLNHISPDAYSLDGIAPTRGYVVDSTPQGWSVSRTEQGARGEGRAFSTADEAYRYLLVALLRDESTRRPAGWERPLAAAMILLVGLALPLMYLLVLGVAFLGVQHSARCSPL